MARKPEHFVYRITVSCYLSTRCANIHILKYYLHKSKIDWLNANTSNRGLNYTKITQTTVNHYLALSNHTKYGMNLSSYQLCINNARRSVDSAMCPLVKY